MCCLLLSETGLLRFAWFALLALRMYSVRPSLMGHHLRIAFGSGPGAWARWYESNPDDTSATERKCIGELKPSDDSTAASKSSDLVG